jgi:L-alanine-DL-glutamate epimerase-like enolase superfamily enzyme
MKISNLAIDHVVLKLQKPIGFALGNIRELGCVLVTLRDSDGVTGESLVFTINDNRTRVFIEMIRSLEPIVIGRARHAIAEVWSDAWKSINFFGHKGISIVGLSAIDCALWDLNGKAAGLPLSRMLGGARARVETYHSGGLWLSMSLDELAIQAHQFVADGFRAIKLRLGSPTLAADEERVKVVRDAIGPSIKLMVDANQGLNEAEALRRGRMLEQYDLGWYEEPLPAWDVEGLARVAAAVDTPIASGETEYTRYGFLRMLQLRSADVLMPDLQRVGGVTEFMKVGHLADAYDVPVSSHLFPEMSIQLLGALSNATYLEYMPWFSPLYNEALEIRDGFATVPDRPGFGFTFDRNAIERLKSSA